MITFNGKYILLACVFFLIEVLIALFVHDSIIRPYVGDYLVVILLYCFIRAFLKSSIWLTATGVLLFAFSIEILQYVNIVNKLGLAENVIARTVIGYGFDWWDILAYTLGVVTILVIERARKAVSSNREA